MKKKSHNYKCDYCKKPAEYQIGNLWKTWEISPDGDFQEVDEWGANNSEWFCAKHFDIWKRTT